MFIKALAIISAIAIMGQVASCSTTAPVISVTSVEAAAQLACSFVPTADTIANLVSANPSLTTAESVAAAICAAIPATPPATASATAPTAVPANKPVAQVTVNGKTVTISGHYVSK